MIFIFLALSGEYIAAGHALYMVAGLVTAIEILDMRVWEPHCPLPG
jgi:hypothetical protein